MILGPTLVTLGQLFIVIGAFLAQMLKVKCISNVFGDTLLMLSRNIFYDHDASVPQLRMASKILNRKIGTTLFIDYCPLKILVPNS